MPQRRKPANTNHTKGPVNVRKRDPDMIHTVSGQKGSRRFTRATGKSGQEQRRLKPQIGAEIGAKGSITGTTSELYDDFGTKYRGHGTSSRAKNRRKQGLEFTPGRFVEGGKFEWGKWAPRKKPK